MADGIESWLNGWATPGFIGYWLIVGPFLLMGLVYIVTSLVLWASPSSRADRRRRAALPVIPVRRGTTEKENHA